MSFQDFKLRRKEISQSFSYWELINLLRNGTIVCCLQENKKMLRKSVFCDKLEVLEWCHNCSQSPVFGLVVLYLTGSEIWRFWYIKRWGRKITIENFFAILISKLGRFNRANKKICHVHFNQKRKKKLWVLCTAGENSSSDFKIGWIQSARLIWIYKCNSSLNCMTLFCIYNTILKYAKTFVRTSLEGKSQLSFPKVFKPLNILKRKPWKCAQFMCKLHRYPITKSCI